MDDGGQVTMVFEFETTMRFLNVVLGNPIVIAYLLLKLLQEFRVSRKIEAQRNSETEAQR